MVLVQLITSEAGWAQRAVAAGGGAGTGHPGLFPGTGSSLVTQNVRSRSPNALAIISWCHSVI